MARPEEIRTALQAALDREESCRERAIVCSRAIVRESRKAVSDMVLTERPIDRSILLDAAAPILGMVASPDLRDPATLEGPLTEVVESMVLSCVLENKELPLPSELGIPERTYALGLCDALGEMRRIVLNRLLRSELESALAMYETMKTLFSVVEGLTYPTGMIPLKRKQDVVRGLMDRTAGELAVTLASRRDGTTDGGDTT